MFNLKRVVMLCTMVILCLLLLSCGASHHMLDGLVYQDDDFSYQQFKKSGLIIGGVSSKVIDMTDKVRLEQNADFHRILLEEMKDAHLIHIMNHIQLLDHIGKDNYFNMMGNYDDEEIVDEGTLHFLADTIPDIQHLLLAYIVNENIADDSYDEYIKEDGETHIETDYHKTYLLTVEFHIYDLKKAKLVWRNSIYNRAEQSESRTTRSGCVEGCIDSIFQGLLFGEPAEIGREEVLAKIYKKFVKKLEKS